MRIHFEERLTGAYRDDRAHDRPLRLDLLGESDPVQAGARVLRFVASGTLTAAGLVERASVGGTISYVRPWSLVYTLRFAAPRGKSYLLVADKRQLRDDAYAGFTTLRGHIVDDATGERVAMLGARFDARSDLGWWLRHLRVSWTGGL